MLYVSSEITGVGVGAAAPGQKKQETAFRFARQGTVNVFYWVNGLWLSHVSLRRQNRVGACVG